MKHTHSFQLLGGRRLAIVAALGLTPLMSACQLQQRRVDVPNASGADDALEDRFGLSADAQDPTERDKELGYGMWKAKPEPEGTAAPESPQRRGQHWNGGGSPR